MEEASSRGRHRMVCMKIMWISHQISTQFMGGFGLHHHQMSGNIFWKNAVHPSNRVPHTWRIRKKEHWSCCGGSWRSNTSPIHTLCWFLPLIYHQFVFKGSGMGGGCFCLSNFSSGGTETGRERDMEQSSPTGHEPGILRFLVVATSF